MVAFPFRRAMDGVRHIGGIDPKDTAMRGCLLDE
jgi:hypothetical protein